MKSTKRKTIMIDGVRYYAERPHDCRKCFFWKNCKVGCTLGRENCYYLAEVIKTEQEKKCENCPYAKGQPCVSASCYKDLEKWLQERRARTVRKMMKEGSCCVLIVLEVLELKGAELMMHWQRQTESRFRDCAAIDGWKMKNAFQRKISRIV